MSKLVSVCSHLYANGKIAVKREENGRCVCKICNDVYNDNPVLYRDLIRAAEIYHNAINQIITECDPSNEKDQILIENLHKHDMENLDLVDVYYRIMDYK